MNPLYSDLAHSILLFDYLRNSAQVWSILFLLIFSITAILSPYINRMSQDMKAMTKKEGMWSNHPCEELGKKSLKCVEQYGQRSQECTDEFAEMRKCMTKWRAEIRASK